MSYLAGDSDILDGVTDLPALCSATPSLRANELDLKLSNPYAINGDTMLVNRADLYDNGNASSSGSDVEYGDSGAQAEFKNILLDRLYHAVSTSLDVRPSTVSVTPPSVSAPVPREDQRNVRKRKKTRAGVSCAEMNQDPLLSRFTEGEHWHR